MSTVQKVANKIYQLLIPHAELVKRIQSLFMWQRKSYSAIFLLFIEICFICIYFLPFSKMANVALICGILSVINVTIKQFPEFFNKILSFELPNLPENASNKLRSIPEIAAMLTTSISIWIKFVELAFSALEDKSIVYITMTTFAGALLFAFLYVIGDFWLMWLVFHVIFVLPGIVLQPKVQEWLGYKEEEEEVIQKPAARFDPSATTLAGED